jgi:hypothetical protein
VIKHDLRFERFRYGDADFATAKRLEYEIFGLANRFTTAEDDAAGEMTAYREWEPGSEFHIAYLRGPADKAGQPVAIARFLRHDPALGADSFSTLRDFRGYRPGPGPAENLLYPEWDEFFRGTAADSIAEMATQSVLPGHRGAGVIEQVWRRFIADSEPEGVRIWTMALVVPMFRWYKAMLPQAVHQIGRMIPQYVGADSIPAMVDLGHPSIRAVLEQYDERPAGGLQSAVTAACVPEWSAA